ncbi:flagellin [Candidatus Latescibacterota bacterium]
MSLKINHNISAMNTHRQLLTTDRMLSGSLEKLSSGLRINRAADDSAGLAISQRLRSQVDGLKMASQNAEQAKNMVQTSEGFLGEIHNMLGRMRVLAVQAASDTVGSSDRTSLQAEFALLRDEVDRIAAAAEYNGAKLLDGTFTGQFQIGANAGANDKIDIAIDSVSASDLNIDATVAGTNISTLTDAVTALTEISTAIDSVSTIRSNLGTIQNRLAYTVASVDNAAENLSASESSIRDLDISEEITSFTKSQILVQAGMSMLAQANAVPQNVLALFR